MRRGAVRPQPFRTRVALVLAAVAIAAPFARMPAYFDFAQQIDKRGLKKALEQGRGEFVRWDPISKINVIDETWTPAISVPWHLSGDRKVIQYDGGNQTSYFYKFNGDLDRLRHLMDTDRSKVTEHFWHLGVLASHYLNRDSGQNVLVIGSAGGRETKAAPIYGAAHVDSVELVPTVARVRNPWPWPQRRPRAGSCRGSTSRSCRGTPGRTPS